jgi:putative protein-disulfide isomerase
VINVVGGLAEDSEQPMSCEHQATIAGYWVSVSEETRAKFNFDFWSKCKPRRSTYPACRAVLTAARQDAEEAMINVIQQAYYQRAMNPSDNAVLIKLADELGLDVQRFSADLGSRDIEAALQGNFALRQFLGINGFPSLVLQLKEDHFPIDLDYRSHLPMLEQICGLLTAKFDSCTG